MLSKKDFLDMVREQIFPILSSYQRERKWLSMLSFKKLIFFLFLSYVVLLPVFSIILGLILNSDFDGLISSLLSVFISIFIFLYLIRCSNKINNKIGKMIMPKILSALNLVNYSNTDKDYNFLDDLSGYGVLPDFDTPFISSSFALKETYYSLLTQFLGLSVETDDRSESVFSGWLISSKKICLPNSSLLILDNRLKHNLTQKELIKGYPKKSLEKGQRWRVIDCDNAQLSNECTVYGINIHDVNQILSPRFIEGIKKIRSFYSIFNLLINKRGIFIAVKTEYPFSLMNMDLKSYEILYDAFKSLKGLDDILPNFEGKY